MWTAMSVINRRGMKESTGKKARFTQEKEGGGGKRKGGEGKNEKIEGTIQNKGERKNTKLNTQKKKGKTNV